MKDFLKENWFKLSILLILFFFCIILLLVEIRVYNYNLLKKAAKCDRHYVKQEWQKCINSYTGFYIGFNHGLKYPH